MNKVTNVILAILGQTKFGKSTLLALLSCIFMRFLRIFSKSNGRTKTLTEYWYDKDNENKDIWIRHIDVRWSECLGGNKNELEAYNTNLKNKPALVKGLGLQPLKEGDNPRKYLEEKLDELLERPITDEEIEKLLCTKDLDSCIRKIVVRVPANDILKAYMEKYDVEISIRDTKGLLDFSVDDELDKSDANLTEIGLDKIDGAIFGCSESYPNVIQEIYADTLKNVFKSVPTFFMARDQRMFMAFGKKESFSADDVDNFITSIQDRSNPDYEDMDDMFFNDTNELFEDLGIMHMENGEYVFSEVYFGKNETTFLFPTSTTLKKFGSGRVEEDELTQAADVRFLQMVVSVSVLKMVSLIIGFRKNIDSIKKDGHARRLMYAAAQKTKGELLVDFDRYDNASHGYSATDYCKPQLKCASKASILTNIDNKDVDILGPNGGITTRNNGKLKFYTAAVVAVSARKWLDRIISAVEVTADICDSTGKPLFSGLSGNYQAQTQLVKSVLRNCLYKEYTDTQATLQYHLCVDRYKAEFGIQERRNAPTLQNAFEQTVEIIVNDFCNSLH
ncbi:MULTISPECIES: hypothetical protein [unclassified Blautia]|uniref:hypothetical protein n=1 Tax=unclassified Blautia TaxID=2648079 RepID=UPI002ECAF84B|nr:hypothetical protein [Agathobacter sp.]